MEIELRIEGEGICQNKFHVDIHDPKSAKVYCNTCESNVKENPVNPKVCQCCLNKIIKKKEYKLTRIMLNNAIEQYENFAKLFIAEPSKGHIILYQKWKWITYEIPLDALALFYDTREPLSIKERKGNLPEWAKKFYSNEQLRKIKEKGILAFIDSRIKSAWIG